MTWFFPSPTRPLWRDCVGAGPESPSPTLPLSERALWGLPTRMFFVLEYGRMKPRRLHFFRMHTI